jgi:hypothetical protein
MAGSWQLLKSKPPIFNRDRLRGVSDFTKLHIETPFITLFLVYIAREHCIIFLIGMNKRTFFCFCLSATILLSSGISYAQVDTGKTQLLILGTSHLSQIKEFDPKMLEAVIAKLDSMSFDAVCIENMSTELLYDIRSRKDPAFGQVLSSFGGKHLLIADSVQAQLGITFLDAQNMIKDLLTKESLTDSDRLSLIELFLAAGDPTSATLHYAFLQDKHIAAKSILPKDYFEDLIRNLKSSNEVYSLALKLAINQELKRIEPIDNFQDEALLLKHFPTFMEDYTVHREAFADIQKLPVFVNSQRTLKEGVERQDLLDHYIYLNSEEFMKQDFEGQWEIWLTTNFSSGSDRARYYLWEMRNLQIAANIMKVCSFYPGKKVIVIIGASHKYFIEKYVGEVSNIEILTFK